MKTKQAATELTPQGQSPRAKASDQNTNSPYSYRKRGSAKPAIWGTRSFLLHQHAATPQALGQNTARTLPFYKHLTNLVQRRPPLNRAKSPRMGLETAGNKTLEILNHSSGKGNKQKLRARDISSPLADQSGKHTHGNSASGQQEHHSAGKFITPYNYATADATPNPCCSLQVRYISLMPYN